MRLYLNAKTNVSDVYVDFIEVRLASGEEVSLNWDESEISRSDDGFSARYKGVYFGDEYANGRIDELKGLEILDVGLYHESDVFAQFEIEEMEFEDDGKVLVINSPALPIEISGLNDATSQSVSEKIEAAQVRANEARDVLSGSREAPEFNV